MRQELGGRTSDGQRGVQQPPVSYEAPTETFDSVSTSELSTPGREELLGRLNKSYKDFRLDYLIMVLSAIAFVGALFSGNAIAIATSAILGAIASIVITVFEAKRRTVQIAYDFEDDDTSSYSKLISAFNRLAECKRIWAYIDSRNITSLHESKINAGASNLISRTIAVAGTGTPPWVETNVTIPTLSAKGTTIYFMPDCLLIYDRKGVGCAKHEDLELSTGVERFIEDGPVPPDAIVVDHTWKFANKKGGPDRRFNNNVRIPICHYGTLKLSLPAGLLFKLQTSIGGAPRGFDMLYSEYISATKRYG